MKQQARRRLTMRRRIEQYRKRHGIEEVKVPLPDAKFGPRRPIPVLDACPRLIVSERPQTPIQRKSGEEIRIRPLTSFGYLAAVLGAISAINIAAEEDPLFVSDAGPIDRYINSR